MILKIVLRNIICCVFGFLLLIACSLPSLKPDPVELTATSLALTPTVIPATPTPLSPLSILVVPENADLALADDLEEKMNELSAQGGMRFQVRPALSPSEMTSEITIVVAIPPDPGIVALAQAAPRTQFVAINIADITAGGNISLIYSESYTPEELAFIAGYIAAVVTPDWRAGILLLADESNASVQLQAFSNGLRFWCGLCQPVYAPFVVYPQSMQITDPTDAITTLSAVDTLSNLGVQTFYVPSEVSSPALLEYIAEKQAMIIGTSQPPESAADHWIVSLQAGNPVGSFESIWTEIMRGEGGKILSIPLDLADTEAGLLDESRKRVIREMLVDLAKGLIYPGRVAD